MTSEDINKPFYCDRCSVARAAYLVKILDGELSFCNHHYLKHKEALDKVAYEIVELDRKEETPQLIDERI